MACNLVSEIGIELRHANAATAPDTSDLVRQPDMVLKSRIDANDPYDTWSEVYTGCTHRCRRMYATKQGGTPCFVAS